VTPRGHPRSPATPEATFKPPEQYGGCRKDLVFISVSNFTFYSAFLLFTVICFNLEIWRGWVWVGMDRHGWLWVGVGGYGWVGVDGHGVDVAVGGRGLAWMWVVGRGWV
jgi:transglutaminase-like putative cysteine protease